MNPIKRFLLKRRARRTGKALPFSILSGLLDVATDSKKDAQARLRRMSDWRTDLYELPYGEVPENFRVYWLQMLDAWVWQERDVLVTWDTVISRIEHEIVQLSRPETRVKEGVL